MRQFTIAPAAYVVSIPPELEFEQAARKPYLLAVVL